ncbi:uncharacterized protein CC84DRAFT_1217372 [Paraphaeosphaeria sporulosa]|uniref:Mid2 domain-containing protein n=1 Tax=Paraphaeosphaeria sporulosa TaxID=1460663 RepID=A0A177CGL6_9PLEO|nr:uncharacterized protein CC84DRAFT_1217372 [Paraphaeosphaeria sporulosa]OAG06102.1 hypothetical protein CC84DRAFT_1217372 [Paraphaeosphaeria sporulosa]
MRVFPSLVLCSCLATAVLAFGSSSCYYANGTEISNTEIKQCSDGVTTVCCALNRENTPGNETNEMGWTQDECVPNGLCQNRYMTDGVPQTTWWLEYCTNPDPTSSECLDVCRHTRDAAGGSRMTPCGASSNGGYNALDDTRDSTRWCCGDSDSCCTNNIDVVELPRNFTGHAVTSSASSSSSTPTASSTSSSQASPTSSPTPTDTKASEAGNNGLSTGVKAGIGAGAAVGVIAILLAAFFGRKAYGYRKLAKQREAEDKYALQPHLYGQEHKYAHTDFAPSELYSNTSTHPAEMPSSEQPRAPTELPGSHERYDQN